MKQGQDLRIVHENEYLKLLESKNKNLFSMKTIS